MQIEIVPRNRPRYDYRYILNGKLYHIDKDLDGIAVTLWKAVSIRGMHLAIKSPHTS